MAEGIDLLLVLLNSVGPRVLQATVMEASGSMTIADDCLMALAESYGQATVSAEGADSVFALLNFADS